MNLPAAMAAAARWFDVTENWSCISRVIPYLSATSSAVMPIDVYASG